VGSAEYVNIPVGSQSENCPPYEILNKYGGARYEICHLVNLGRNSTLASPG